jgi:hypothetical protein
MDREEVLKRAEIVTWEVLLLVLAYVVCIISAVASVKTCDGSWFSRSGSLMVLFAAIVEYRNFGIQQKLNEIAQESTNYWNAEPEKWRVPNKRKIFDRIVIITLVIGTLIWGYGDLLYGGT